MLICIIGNKTLLLLTYVCFVRCIMIDSNEPAERSRHSVVRIEDFVYLWGGWQKNLPKVHSSDEKERLTSHVHAFHCKLGE